MIVIERDGKTNVITGWRAWVIGAVAVVVMTAVPPAQAFLVLGIAVSMVAFLLTVMPAIAIVAVMAFFTRPSPM
jgi:Na+/H+ antiporter NhaD/arsenite permease-like protein